MHRVFVDILANLAISILIPKNLVVERFLPNGESDLFGDPSFHRPDHRLERYVRAIRPFLVIVSGMRIFIRQNEDNHVYVIRHDAIPVEDNFVIMRGDLPDCRFNDRSILRQWRLIRLRNRCALFPKKRVSVCHTNCDEIRASRGIIVPVETILLACPQLHNITPIAYTGLCFWFKSTNAVSFDA